MTRILCLWLANWPIQRIARSRPELKGRPMALATSGPRGAEVAVCSSAAVAQGVRVAMPVAEAQAPAPQLVILPHEPLRDRQALAKLAEACERFSPCVGLEETVEPESLLLDISNLDHLWGSEAALVEQVEKFFKRRGYRVRLGVAGTIGLAWALAHFAEGNFPTKANDEARMTNDEIHHSSLVIRHSSFTRCRKLPVEALRISPETAALLRELGVETIHQLMLLARGAHIAVRR